MAPYWYQTCKYYFFFVYICTYLFIFILQITRNILSSNMCIAWSDLILVIENKYPIYLSMLLITIVFERNADVMFMNGNTRRLNFGFAVFKISKHRAFIVFIMSYRKQNIFQMHFFEICNYWVWFYTFFFKHDFKNLFPLLPNFITK